MNSIASLAPPFPSTQVQTQQRLQEVCDHWNTVSGRTGMWQVLSLTCAFPIS